MANGKLTLGKQSGGTLGLVFPDGVSNTEVVLPESGNLASVNTAVTDNAIARYDGTTGKLQNSGVYIDDSGRIISTLAGSSYIGYTFAGQESKTGILCPANEQLNIKAIQGTYFTSGAFGYGAGAGGTVTQLTSKNTPVTLNKPSGMVITHSGTLVGGEIAYFSLYNTLVSTLDTIIVNCNNGSYNVTAYGYQGNGIFVVAITNRTSVALSDTLYINFTIIKGGNV